MILFARLKGNHLHYFNGFAKAKERWQKRKKIMSIKVELKRYTKHYLYCVLCCRFNATQHQANRRFNGVLATVRNLRNKKKNNIRIATKKKYGKFKDKCWVF